MTRDTKVKVQLLKVERVATSLNGNARYEFYTNYGIYRTKVDTSRALNFDFPTGELLDIRVELILANGNTNSVWDWKKL